MISLPPAPHNGLVCLSRGAGNIIGSNNVMSLVRFFDQTMEDKAVFFLFRDTEMTHFKKIQRLSIHTPCAQLTRWNHDNLATRTLHTPFGGITTYSQLVRQRCCQIPQNTFFVVFRLLLWRTRIEN